MRVETLTPVVTGAPGSRVQWRIRVENDATVPVGYRLRVIGFDAANVLQPPPRAPLEPGSSDELDLELLIPEAFAAGHHSIAIEVTPDRVGVAPVIAAVTVTVGTIDDVALAVIPSTIRARRRATFRVDIDNRSREPRELELEADSAELEIRMQPDRVLLQPGERVRTTGRIKGPRHLVGEPRQHSLTVAARSKSAPSYAPATFQQRALFPRGVRTIVAMLLIVGIWGGALGAGYLWWQSRDDEQADAPAELVDTNGDGIRDTPADQLVDTDGDGVPDTLAAVVAEQVASGAALGDPQPGGSDVPTRTSMGGTVAAADGGQAPDVDVTLTPIDVGAPLPEGATQLGFRNGELREVEPVTAAKFWPARFGRYQPDIRSGYRQTQSVPDATSTDARGVWYFGSLSVGQSYEVSFSRPGFDTQSFVVTPSADGKPIDLPVEMQPADGVVRGTVTGPGGGLGNVTLTLSDGTLVFDSASASEGDVGTFSFTGVSTPGTYTLLANARGLGTEVVQVTLEEGEDRGGVNIRMSPGVGSISGRVTEGGTPLGGVTLTASNGDTTVETTSLTQGAVGTYLFPRLTIPGRWTIEARLDGYVTQTRLVNLSGNVGGIDFAFVKRTGSIIGLVESSNGGPLPGVNIRVSRDDLVFESQSAVSPDPGSFNIRDVPPGTYLVELSRYDHEPTSQTVTVEPGRATDLGTVTLVFRPRPNIPQNGGLEVQVVDSEGAPIRPSETAPGATVRVLRTSDNSLVAEQVGTPDQSSFFFQPLPIGTYRVEVTRGPTYRLATRNASVGLSNTVVVIPIYRLGQVFGRVIDSFTKEDLDDYDIQIMRVLATGEVDPSPVQNIPILDNHPPDPATGQIRWESAAASLTTGLYEVRVSKPPPGYSVTPDQELVAGQPLMRFRVLPTDDRPIELRPIEADHFPELSGTVLAPRLGAGNAVSFVPIDRADLEVTLTCPGVDGVDQSVTLATLAPPNLPGTPANSGLGEFVPSGAGFDTFFFSPVTLQGNDLFGACTLRVSADDADYVPVEFDVLVSPGDGSSNPLLFRNVVLFRPEDVGGRLYWMDDGTTPATQVWAPDVSVAAQGAVTIGMTPGTVPYDSTGSNPNLQTAPLPAVFTDENGAWAYADPKQVFGEGFYTITAPGRFELRRIRLTINETRKTAVGVEPDPSPLVVNDDGTLVELDAVGGQITTQLNVRTIKGSLSGLSATLTGANAPPAAALAVIGGNVGGQLPMAATFATPDPGTHQWTVTVPPGPSADRPLFVPVDGSGGPSPDFLQEPGTDIAPSPDFPQLTKTYAEMGAMDLRVTNSTGVAIGGATGTLTPVSGGTPIPFTTDGAGNATLLGLPVSTAPNGTGSYRVALTGPDDLDFGQAVFTVTGAAGAIGACGDACAVVPVAQGGQPLVAIRVPRFGTLAGTVLGDNGTPAGVPLFPPDLTVIAERIAVDCTEMAAEPPREVIPVDLDGDGEDESFRFSGPPGMYRLRFEHPAYQSEPTSGPPQELQDCQIPNQFPPPALLPNPNPNLNGAVFRVTNDQDRVLTEPFFTLLIRPSEVFIDVLHDSLTLGANGVGAPVPAATVRIGPNDADPTTGTNFLTDANGEINLTADADRLDPGVYLIEVSKTAAAGTPEYFPLAVRLTIPPGGRPVTLRVPLSRIGGSITGRVGAVNSEQDPVAPPAGIQVTSVADAFDPAVTNATVDTAPNPGPGTGTVTPPIAGSPPGTPNTFQFAELRSGTYTLTFNDPGVAGYSPPSPNPIVPAVTVLGPVPVDVPATVNYTVANRVVEVTVVDGGDTPIEAATVTLDDPDSGPPAVLTTGVDGVVRFENVPPEIQPYQVTVSKDLFTTVGPTALTVPPGDPAVAVTPPADVVLRGSQSRIRGRAELLSSPGNQGPLTAADSIQLVRDANGVPVGDPVTPDATGRFEILTGVPDRYRVRVSGTGFATRESAAFDVVLGRPEVVPGGAIVVPALATVNVTVTGPAATTVTGRAVPTSASTPAPAAPSVAESVFTFRLDPGDTYRFEFTSTAGYVPLTVPAPPAAAQSVAPGQVVALTAAMQQRTITGTISGGTATAVRAVAGTGTTPPFIDGTVTAGTYTITGVPNGTWTIQAAGFRVGRGVGTTSVAVGSTTANVTAGPAVTLTPRDVTITFTVAPPNASIAIGGAAAQPAAGGTLQVTRPENATFPIAFTVTAPGFVADSDEVPAPTAPSDPYVTGFAVAAPTVNLVPVVATARVDSSAGAAVTDAQVFLCAGSVAACGPTTVGRIAMTFSDGLYRGSPTADGAWTVGATSGTLAAVTSFTVSDAGAVSASPVVVTLPAPPPPPTTTTTTTTTTAAPGG